MNHKKNLYVSFLSIFQKESNNGGAKIKCNDPFSSPPHPSELFPLLSLSHFKPNILGGIKIEKYRKYYNAFQKLILRIKTFMKDGKK